MRKNRSVGIIVATIIALIVILFSISTFRDTLEKRYTANIYSRLAELSVSNAASINAKIADQFEMMEMLATYLADQDLTSLAVQSLLVKTVDSYGFLRSAITFPDGSFITHDQKHSENTSADDYVIQGFQGISTVTGPRSAVVDESKTVILLSVPIYQGSQVIALLTCTYETRYLENVFQMTSFNGQGYSYITDAQGQIISKPELTGLIGARNNILIYFQEYFPDSYSKIASDIKGLKSGTVLLTIPEQQKYLSYQPLGLNGWYVFSVTSGEALEGQLSAMLGNVYLLTALIIATLVVLMVLIWFYIQRLQEKSKKALEKLAYCDSLTSSPNRNLFEKEAQRILDTAPGEYAYIILNVNKFKLINDIFGFAQGDQLLVHISETLRQEAGKDEICARFDADNFHILSIYTSKDLLEKRMLSVAHQISAFCFDKNIPHQLSVGFGAYLIEDKSLSISLMGDKARMALSKIKGIHSPTTYFYNSEIIDQFMVEQEIENDMQGALAGAEMKLYLQPKCSTETQQIHSAEALVRWQHPSKGLIMPDAFIPLFERNGFIINLDMYMIEVVCQKLQEWQGKKIRVIPISVNQSRACLYQPSYVQKLMQILDKYAISPTLIEVEITERAFYEDQSTLIRIIQELHDFGFKVAMDDFGVGYSSLNTLQDVLVDVLKIDKNFFKESINSERGKKIVTNIVSMANDLTIEVVAEGIETKEQLDFLGAIHCGSVQGYYFSKPIPTDIFEETYGQ